MNIFYQRIYAVVKHIPLGKVASYGKIAASLDRPRASREVGRAMRCCPADDIPWQRVVMADGSIAGGGYAEERKELLTAEGVEFLPDGRVDMKRCSMDPVELDIIAQVVCGEIQSET